MPESIFDNFESIVFPYMKQTQDHMNELTENSNSLTSFQMHSIGDIYSTKISEDCSRSTKFEEQRLKDAQFTSFQNLNDIEMKTSATDGKEGKEGKEGFSRQNIDAQMSIKLSQISKPDVTVPNLINEIVQQYTREKIEEMQKQQFIQEDIGNSVKNRETIRTEKIEQETRKELAHHFLSSPSSVSQNSVLFNRTSSQTQIDELLEPNITEWKPVDVGQRQFCSDVEIIVDGIPRSQIEESERKQIIQRWRKQDLLVMSGNLDNSISLLLRIKPELGMPSNDDVNCEMSAEEQSSIQIESGKDANSEYFKRKEQSVKRQIKEAKEHWKLFGVWIQKDWATDEWERQMWRLAAERTLKKEFKDEHEMKQKMETNSTLEELKNELNEKMNEESTEDDLLTLKRKVAAKEMKHMDKEKKKNLSEADRFWINFFQSEEKADHLSRGNKDESEATCADSSSSHPISDEGSDPPIDDYNAADNYSSCYRLQTSEFPSDVASESFPIHSLFSSHSLPTSTNPSTDIARTISNHLPQQYIPSNKLNLQKKPSFSNQSDEHRSFQLKNCQPSNSEMAYFTDIHFPQSSLSNFDLHFSKKLTEQTMTNQCSKLQYQKSSDKTAFSAFCGELSENNEDEQTCHFLIDGFENDSENEAIDQTFFGDAYLDVEERRRKFIEKRWNETRIEEMRNLRESGYFDAPVVVLSWRSLLKKRTKGTSKKKDWRYVKFNCAMRLECKRHLCNRVEEWGFEMLAEIKKERLMKKTRNGKEICSVPYKKRIAQNHQPIVLSVQQLTNAKNTMELINSSFIS
ncbi:uncharacterized protein MONOS_3588 [Monocercomonoides exilis]|uniref:uncharacterized protein n=1 Tax=Monocercomonoides exilis TaxID=2049356 RepID=UPI00355A0681|nr:hypothetical protein MONOS_3588 [Monocercomonoides exilis]|eukprot:MONOS_3588.1-p1 / transcript=MONOS_3588.1 / gene=MONOS_3588 / organism=Monocercomonoides_exilis_PA203 / gene_product=unspecified product / transcript_product=unspecified product / location=Mono_scaffold00085:125867-128266(+) / protein_length=800 / sequence_SO=supercontig / SO=protein_coding / is_pseudo=false